MSRQPRTFKYLCPNCGVENTAVCRRCKSVYRFDPVKQPDEKWVIQRARFGERQWLRIFARAKLTPSVNGPAEQMRMMCDECLAMPPVRLISS